MVESHTSTESHTDPWKSVFFHQLGASLVCQREGISSCDWFSIREFVSFPIGQMIDGLHQAEYVTNMRHSVCAQFCVNLLQKAFNSQWKPDRPKVCQQCVILVWFSDHPLLCLSSLVSFLLYPPACVPVCLCACVPVYLCACVPVCLCAGLIK